MYDKEKLNAGLDKLTGLDYIAAQKRFKATHKDFLAYYKNILREGKRIG